MSRPTEDIIEDMDPSEIGCHGCLIPSDDVTAAAEEGEADE